LVQVPVSILLDKMDFVNYI